MGWRTEAACLGVDPNLFFPVMQGRSKAGVEARPRAICAACPVRGDCLDEALARREPNGIWGGLDADERLAIVRSRRLSTVA